MKYVVEQRPDYLSLFDNYVGDYITADSEEEAIEIAKQCLVDCGCEREYVDDWEYKVSPYAPV